MLQAADAVDTAAAAADTAAAEPHGRAEAAAPFPRPRGRGPPGCTWDVLQGGWFRADGSAWKKVRNVKRELAKAARRPAKDAARWARLDEMACKAEKRLQLQREACEAREAAVAARDARARLVRFDGTTVYCAKHLIELDVVGRDDESAACSHAMCGACVELGWRDVRRAPQPTPKPVSFSPTPASN